MGLTVSSSTSTSSGPLVPIQPKLCAINPSCRRRARRNAPCSDDCVAAAAAEAEAAAASEGGGTPVHHPI